MPKINNKTQSYKTESYIKLKSKAKNSAGIIDNDVLIAYGKENIKFSEKVSFFFKNIKMIFKGISSEERKLKKTETFKTKATKLINKKNTQKITKLYTDTLSSKELLSSNEKLYLMNLIKNDNKVHLLVKNSLILTQFDKLRSEAEAQNKLFDQIKNNMDEKHWLQAYKVELGNEFEKLDPFSFKSFNTAPIKRILEVNTVSSQHKQANINELLKKVLDNTPIIEMTDEQLETFKNLLELETQLHNTLASLSSLKFFDRSMLSTILHKEPITLESIAFRAENIKHVEDLFKFIKIDRNISLTKEFIKQIFIPELIIQLDLDRKLVVNPAQIKSFRNDEVILKDSVKKIIKFINKKINKNGAYPQTVIVSAFKEIFSGLDKNIDPLNRLKHIATESDNLMNSNFIKQVQAKAVNQFVLFAVTESGKAHHLTDPNELQSIASAITSKLTNQISGLKSIKAANYIKEVIDFAVQLHVDNDQSKLYGVIRKITEEANQKKSPILLDIKKINGSENLSIPGYVKVNIQESVKSLPKNDSSIFERILGDDSFGVINELVSQFFTNFIPKENEKQLKDMKKALAKLGPAFNNSFYVKAFLPAIIGTLTTMAELKKIDSKNQVKPDFLRDALLTKIQSLIDLDLSSKQNMNLNEFKQLLNNSELGILDTILTEISSEALNANKVLKGIKPEGNKSVITTVFKILIGDVLPTILDNQSKIKTIINQLPGLIKVSNFLNIDKLVGTILTKYIQSKIKEIDVLDEASKKLIIDSIPVFIKTFLLVVPTLIEKHKIDHYFNFLNALSKKFNENPEMLTKEELYGELLETTQFLATEIMGYKEIIAKTIDNTAEMLVNKYSI